ncbi:hypothetical protein L7F22_024029 [Adiantum nelumboides]|nr:hypothetical protein [Adiantum nelumboides]
MLGPSALVALLAYHGFLLHKVRTSPFHTRMGINCLARSLWVREMHTENHKKNVLVVQTLRNSIMESTLLAVMAVLLIVALATYYKFFNRSKHLLNNGIDRSLSSTMATTIKSCSVLTCCFISLLCHTRSICFYNYVIYVINIPIDWWISTEHIAELLQRATFLYVLGSRAFYMVFPLLLWVFGSIPMFLCGLALLHVLYYNDFPHSMSSNILQNQN